jgi:hypothetical protein
MHAGSVNFLRRIQSESVALMKFLLCGIAVLALVACLPKDDSVEIGVSDDPLITPICATAKYENLVGTSIHILNLRSDGRIRILKPNSVMTLDSRPERTNIYTDEDGVIIKVSCG